MKITVKIDLSLDLEIDIDDLMGDNLRELICVALEQNHMHDIMDSIEVSE
jgi:hypothetical protein